VSINVKAMTIPGYGIVMALGLSGANCLLSPILAIKIATKRSGLVALDTSWI